MIVYKVEVELVDKGYGINLQHYPTSSFVPYKYPTLTIIIFFILCPNENK
jgi:hypothetical protein